MGAAQHAEERERSNLGSRVTAVSAALPVMLEWVGEGEGSEERWDQRGASLDGWKARERANGLPSALFDPEDAGVDDGR